MYVALKEHIAAKNWLPLIGEVFRNRSNEAANTPFTRALYDGMGPALQEAYKGTVNTQNKLDETYAVCEEREKPYGNFEAVGKKLAEVANSMAKCTLDSERIQNLKEVLIKESSEFVHAIMGGANAASALSESMTAKIMPTEQTEDVINALVVAQDKIHNTVSRITLFCEKVGSDHFKVCEDAEKVVHDLKAATRDYNVIDTVYDQFESIELLLFKT